MGASLLGTTTVGTMIGLFKCERQILNKTISYGTAIVSAATKVEVRIQAVIANANANERVGETIQLRKPII